MKTIKLFAPALAFVLITGCATTFQPWSLSRIHEGMDRSQVVEILGKPDSTEMKDGTEQLHYSYREDYYPGANSTPFYTENTEMAFRDLDKETAFREYEYVVILAVGKVVNYMEL